MSFKALAIIVAVSSAAICSTGFAARDTPAPEDAAVYFVNLKDGDTVSNPVLVQFGLKNMGVSPAGIQGVPGTGHHHLLVDTELTGEALSRPIPADAKHLHFGKGQTETLVELPPGTHTLQLVLGDWKHVPHTKPIRSEKIQITVK